MSPTDDAAGKFHKLLMDAHPDGIDPRAITKKVLDDPGQYDVTLVWICTNYSMAMNMIDIYEATREVAPFLKAYEGQKTDAIA